MSDLVRKRKGELQLLNPVSDVILHKHDKDMCLLTPRLDTKLPHCHNNTYLLTIRSDTRYKHLFVYSLHRHDIASPDKDTP